MTMGFAAKNLFRAAVIVSIASAAGGCSSVPGWMNPFGDDPKSVTADDDGALSPNPDADSGGATPDLANVPDRPTAATTPDSQRQVAESLAADRSRAKYSADALRGDAQKAAAPPGPPVAVVPDTTTASTTSSTAPSTADDSASPPSSSSSDTTTTADNTIDSTNPQTPSSTTTADTTPPPPTRIASAVAPSSDTMSAPSASVGDGRPAVPAVPSGGAMSVPGAQAPSMTDSQLGFQRSAAPPLDASVAQFVAPSIINRYRQTAGGNVALASAAVPVSASNSRRSRGAAVGGPEEMSGSVVANLDSLSGVQTASPAVYAGPSGTPSSVVFFPGDTTVLSAAAKAQVHAAAESFRSRGSSGFIRVVGHASSRTGNMPLERHLVVIFEKSQQRANSVAQALIRDGVPADKVLVEAVGDTQPVYYESMPKGEDGNRRAEIFLQS